MAFHSLASYDMHAMMIVTIGLLLQPDEALIPAGTCLEILLTVNCTISRWLLNFMLIAP